MPVRRTGGSLASRRGFLDVPEKGAHHIELVLEPELQPGSDGPAAPLSHEISPRARAFRAHYAPEATDAQWNDWKWQLQHRVRDLASLERAFELSASEREAVIQLGDRLPVGITPYYASLLYDQPAGRGLRKTMLPMLDELTVTRGEEADPLGEDGHMAVEGLVHRYPDRVLFLVTSFCATYCRYCTRSRLVGKTGEYHFNKAQYERALQYIAAHPEIRDVLISGGDPLTMSDERLDWLLGSLRAIPHVEFVRVGSKVPSVLPQRVTPELCAILRKHMAWVSVHFMHPDEVTPEVSEACGRLADSGVPLGAQVVLNRDVNDSVETMKSLMHRLLRIRVRPYYIYQCDPIPGSAHFRTPIEKGLKIIEALRGHTTGYAVPTFVIDAPGGGGKIPVSPNYFVGRDGDDVVLRNYEGLEYRYPDPVVTGAAPLRPAS
ncbi:L-lysine 2,3-aminomutase [Planctomycetes bacterium Poly30]|uniref:L-lysine 2,3-aminomutase n=1 Tax=Saltatorellus ferox TaxID=2528018 RepID=A0A518EW81_9BACT|nr:L-lysine 2,3-aminomutase [Planctomycetes bacterium Poly30]